LAGHVTTLRAHPITRAAARAWIDTTHRHLKAPAGDVIRVALVDDTGTIRCVAMAGRPVARGLDDGLTLEVTRVASDGAPNACSMAYGALRRAAVALGYRRIVTYSTEEEGGASLRAAGWTVDGTVKGRQWSCASRPRGASCFDVDKIRWAWVKP
jgi:hypothetical protein